MCSEVDYRSNAQTCNGKKCRERKLLRPLRTAPPFAHASRSQTPFGNASIETPFREQNPLRELCPTSVKVLTWAESSFPIR